MDCEKEAAGIEPAAANSEYWQKLFDIDALTDARIEEKIKQYMGSNE